MAGLIVPEVIVERAADIYALKLYFTGAFAILVYDYVLTFPAEVECVWRAPKSFVSVVFLLNRYISLIFGVVTLISYFSPWWTFNICSHYAVIQFIHLAIGFTLAEIFLTLRAHVLTGKRKFLTALLTFHIVAQVILAIYVVSRGRRAEPIPFPLSIMPQYQICLSAQRDGMLDLAYLCLALSFDVIVFILTLQVTVTTAKSFPRMRVMQVIQRGGISYFVAIFTSTLVWVFMSLLAEPNYKMINAEPDMIFTAIFINRLHLSLKKVGLNRDTIRYHDSDHRRHMNTPTLEVLVSHHITSQYL